MQVRKLRYFLLHKYFNICYSVKLDAGKTSNKICRKEEATHHQLLNSPVVNVSFCAASERYYTDEQPITPHSHQGD